MVLNAEKMDRLAAVLAARQGATTGAGTSAPPPPPSPQALPTTPPTSPQATSSPITVIPLVAVRASPPPAPLEGNDGVVVVVSDDEEDTADGHVFKRRKVNTVATSHSSSSRCTGSVKKNPPSASSAHGFPAVEGGAENVSEPTPAPELPLVLRQILQGYQRGPTGSLSDEAVQEN